MKRFKRVFSVFLTMLLLFSSIYVEATGTETIENSKTIISVENKSVVPGEKVDIDVSIKNNPGILGMTLEVSYDEGLVLENVSSGDVFDYLTMTKPSKFKSPCRFTWDGEECKESDIKDGTILTLTFRIEDGVETGKPLTVKIDSHDGDIFDNNLNYVNTTMVDGSITLLDFIPGDVNGDGKVSVADIVLLRRYIVGENNVEINKNAANVNDDAKINSVDVISIRRYIAGGYGIELKPPTTFICNHQMKMTNYKAASCTEEGNIQYWQCIVCEKYFSDEYGNHEIILADTVIPENGHSIVIDEAVEPTPSKPGLTEGSHCLVCGQIIVAQVEIFLEQHKITYDIANGDSYLASLQLEPNNPRTFTVKDSIRLTDISVPGYRFLGWYDSAVGGNRITKIEEGTNEDIQLYAHWDAILYEVQFKSSLIKVDPVTYTVGKGVVLPTPSLGNYIFAGWSDDKGNLYTSFPAGTTGDIILEANWTSERNKTLTKKELDDPIIYEDNEENIIYFAYEIGEMQNVPLYTIKDFGYISGDGITKTETTTYSVTTSKAEMEAYTKASASATTQSSSWTLSDNWTDRTSIDKSWCKEKGLTEEQATTLCKSNTNTWNISSGNSGSTSTTELDSNQSDKKNEVKIGASKSKTDKMAGNINTNISAGASLSANIENTATIGGKVSAAGQEVSASDSVKMGLGSTISAGIEVEKGQSWSQEGSESGNIEIGGNNGTTILKSKTSNHSSSWNSNSSYGGSQTNSESTTASRAISEKIAETYGYGEEYIRGGSSSNSQGFTSANSISNEYSSSVTYNTSVQESVTSTWTTQSTKPGYHRWVVAGTAHVFAVVGYDISSSSYFVYTYSVMDDATHEFEDYSYSSSTYDDHQNGVISFEIPYEVEEYVANRVAFTPGLKVDSSTGVITQYKGTDSVVIVPEYMNISNNDGTNKVVKITGISENAFKDNDTIKAVVLSDYITEIPQNAFSGCTLLLGVGGSAINSIGNNAFKDCTSFEAAVVSGGVDVLGTDAFDGVGELYVYASNVGVVQNAISSDVNKMILYLFALNDSNQDSLLSGSVLEVPETVEFFAFNGYGGKYNDTVLISNAKKTMINRATFNGVGDIPLRISSNEVILNQVNVESSGIGILFNDASTELGLQGTVSINTANANSLLCRNLNLYESNENAIGRLVVNGKSVVCGNIEGIEYLDCNDIVYVDEETFERMLHSYTLTFDVNSEDGVVSETSKVVACSQQVGELPTPVRDYYTFLGWYTDESAGTKVTESTIFTEDTTIYAHWEQNPVTDWTEASNVPEDAEIIETKWMYTLREYTESSSSQLDGYTKYDTRRTGWGPTQGPVDYDPSNGERNVWSESYVVSSNYKTVYHYFRYSTGQFASGGSDKSGTKYGSNYYTYDFDYELTIPGSNGNYSQGYKYYYNAPDGNTVSGKYITVWKNDPFTTQEWVSDNYGTRWYYQDPVYTYYFYRDVNKESSSDPTGQDNVSNVVKYVKYRAK